MKNNFIECGRLTYELLEYLHTLIKPGITALYLDEAAVQWADRHNCKLENYGYKGFSGHICVNINEEVQHSIPGFRRIENGDIVNIDLTIRYKGVVTDAARTWAVGKVDSKYIKFIDYTKKAFNNACKIVKSGVSNYELTKKVQEVADKHHYYPVVGLTGHGIGEEMHMAPLIPNNVKDYSHIEKAVLEENKAYCIEPIFLYKPSKLTVLRDGWTIVSENVMHAQYEDTIFITDSGYINVTNGSIIKE